MKNSEFEQQKSRLQEKDTCDTLLARDYKDPKLVIEKTKRLGGLYDKENETHQAGSIYDSEYSAPTLDCSSGGGHRQPFIVEKGINNKNLKDTLEKTDLDSIEDVAYIDAYNKNTITDGTAKTILTGVDYRNQDFLLIKNATKKGYLEATEGDGIDISSRMDTHRGTVQKGLAQTITTMGGENVGVVVNENKTTIPLKRGYSCDVLEEKESSEDIDVIGNYSKSNYVQTSIVGKNGVAPTVTENHGQVTAITENNVAISDTMAFNPYYSDKNMLRIRKLTPKECGRLMGIKDVDIDLILENQSNSSGYHLFGDSIVTTCLMSAIGQMLDIDWKEKFKPEEWWK